MKNNFSDNIFDKSIWQESDIVFANNLDDILSKQFSHYAIHILCTKGSYSFKMFNKTFIVKDSDFVILTANSLVSDIASFDDLEVKVLYVSFRFARNYMPNNDYDLIGGLSLLENPVMPLIQKEQDVCRASMEMICWRLQDKTHHFYSELMGYLVVAFFLDLYEIHVRINIDKNVSEQNALLLRRFIALLETGDYKTNREVAHYASKLYVTPKYFSEICKKVSGRTPMYWIDRFTIVEITRLLKNKELTLTEISEQMNFSSMSYFSRYVLRILGVSPTEYRQQLN